RGSGVQRLRRADAGDGARRRPAPAAADRGGRRDRDAAPAALRTGRGRHHRGPAPRLNPRGVHPAPRTRLETRPCGRRGARTAQPERRGHRTRRTGPCPTDHMSETSTEILVVGGGLGGVAAALAAADSGRRVVLTEETDWIGGQLTSQAVPPDENPWIEMFGATASYRRLREGIRDHYRRAYPLRAEAAASRTLNPGAGRVSKLCHEPRVALAVLEEMIGPHRAAGRVTVLLRHRPVAAHTDGGRVLAVDLRDEEGGTRTVRADYVLDATENGDLLPMTGTAHVTGAEARSEHGEPHAPETADPANLQGITYCFAVSHHEGEDHTIDRPETYDFWRSYRPGFWPGPLLGFSAPDPRTLEPVERTFAPNPDVDPLAV